MFSKEINRLRSENLVNSILLIIYFVGGLSVFFISMSIFIKIVLSFFCGSLIYRATKKITNNLLQIKILLLKEKNYKESRKYQNDFNRIIEELMNDPQFKNIYEQYKNQYQYQYQYQNYSQPQSSKLSNAYQLLKLKPESTIEEIKNRYRELAMKWHPDRWVTDCNTNQNIAKRNFQKLQSAYELIKKDKGIV